MSATKAADTFSVRKTGTTSYKCQRNGAAEFHKVELEPDFCDCDGFHYRKNCAHVKAVHDYIEETAMTTTELTRIDRNDIIPMESHTGMMGSRTLLKPANLAEALEMAKLFHESGMYQVRSVAQAFVVLAMGMELGLTATQAFRSIHVIKEKPCPSADLMVGLCKSAPVCIYFKLIMSTNDKAIYETHRRGEDPVQMGFDTEDAKRAGLTSNDNYRKFPANMLRARAASSLARAVYPDVCAGMYVPEEMETVEVKPVSEVRIITAEPADTVTGEVAITEDDAKKLKALRLQMSKSCADLIKGFKPEHQKAINEHIQTAYRKKFGVLNLDEYYELSGYLDTLTFPDSAAEAPQTFRGEVEAKAGVTVGANAPVDVDETKDPFSDD